MTRIGPTSLHLSVALFAAALVVAPRSAHACGALVFAEEDNGSMSDQQVLIAKGRDRTSLVVSVGYSGAAKEFAFLLPLQREPLAVQDSDPGLFVRLDEISRPRVRIVDDSAGHSSGGCGCIGGGMAAGAKGPGGAEEVELLQRGETATYQYVVVGGSSGTSVQAWLDKESFKVAPSATSAIDGYLSRGWVFLAARLKPKADTGNLAPIEIDYPAMKDREIRYPFALSATSVPAGRKVAVDLYLLSHLPLLPKNYRVTRVDHAKVKALTDTTTNYREMAEQAMSGGAFLMDFGISGVPSDFVFEYWEAKPAAGGATPPLTESYQAFFQTTISVVRLRAKLGAGELHDLELAPATADAVAEDNTIIVHIEKPLSSSAFGLLFGVAWARRRLAPRRRQLRPDKSS